MKLTTAAAIAIVAAGGLAASAAAMPTGFSDWSHAKRVESQPGTPASFNGDGLDGCPFVARDDRTLYMASVRPGGLGGIDIWVAHRDSPGEPWGVPENVGAPVNSPDNDFCPTLDRDNHTLFFVSNRAGGCGGADIYVTRERPDGWDDPRNLGCSVNSGADEAGPFPLPEPGKGDVLYFSSVRPGGFAPEPPGAAVGDSDVYVSERDGGIYLAPKLVPGVNTAFEDGQPNLRRDAREIFFYSNRPGTLGMADIYSATRASTSDPWSAPFNLGPEVNSANGADTRPSLSWDGTTLYFGSTRPGGDGGADHYVTTRSLN